METEDNCFDFLVSIMGACYSVLEKTNMLMLTKEATQKDKSLKTQYLMKKQKFKRDEHMWKDMLIFLMKKVILTSEKSSKKYVSIH